ncbi:MAG: hypothetical protein WBB19_00410 [Desulforhopalus sp.]
MIDAERETLTYKAVEMNSRKATLVYVAVPGHTTDRVWTWHEVSCHVHTRFRAMHQSINSAGNTID